MASTTMFSPVPPRSATTSRVMLPDDANSLGNVHGGTILKMVEEAGVIAATRFANQTPGSDAIVTPLARIEKMDFLKPMHIGEIASLEAKVTYASNHSIEVFVEVFAENPFKGTKRLTNQAHCWFVATSFSDATAKVPSLTMTPIAPVLFENPEEAEEGKARYELQKKSRSEIPSQGEVDIMKRQATSTLVQAMLPGDCNSAGYVRGGVIMKLMDTVAGIDSIRHCRSPAVTVSLESMDFHAPVRNGNVVSLYSKPVFTSSKTIEIDVLVLAENLQGITVSNRSRFIFVGLDNNGRPTDVPMLVPKTDRDRLLFDMGKARYEERKAAKAKAKAAKAAKSDTKE